MRKSHKKGRKLSRVLLNAVLCAGLLLGSVPNVSAMGLTDAVNVTESAADTQIMSDSVTGEEIPFEGVEAPAPEQSTAAPETVAASEPAEEPEPAATSETPETTEPVEVSEEAPENADLPETTMMSESNFIAFAAAPSGLETPAALALAGKTTEAITVDGNLSEGVWNTADANSVEVFTESTINNNKTTFRTAWDNDRFYIAVHVEDAAVIEDVGGNIYENDSIEIFLDGDNSKGASYDKKNDFHIFVQNNGAIAIWGGKNGTWSATTDLDGKLDCAVVKSADGYNLELSVSFEGLGIAPADGVALGLAVTNNDNDNPTESARKEITWNAGQNSGKPATWGVVCLYDTRKPVISGYGSPVVKNGNENWDASLWNFSDDYSLSFANIENAKVKFASLSDFNYFYLGMLIEDAGDSAPFVESFLSGDNKRTGGARQEYGCIIQWNPTASEIWQKVNPSIGTGMDRAKLVSGKYDLGNGSYAFVMSIPWDQLGAVADPVSPRANYSLMSFSVATGNNSGIANGTNTRWTADGAWSGNALATAASIFINNPNIREMNANVAPTGSPLYCVSIPQGGTASGKVKVTDANEGDTLSYTLETGYDAAAYGSVTVNAATGEWTYTTPNADFVKPDRRTPDPLNPAASDPTGVNFFVIATDTQGEAFRTRVEIKVEYAATNRTYYVDGDTGNDSFDGLSYAQAFKTIGAADKAARPGDTVLIYESAVPYGWYSEEEYAADPGLYQTVRNGAITITHSGLPGAPITYKAAPGQRPVCSANGTWGGFKVMANYIEVEGLSMVGRSNELTYEGAYKAFWEKIAPKTGDEYSSDWNYRVGLYNTNGFSVDVPAKHDATTAESLKDPNVCITHHVTFRNCYAEYMPASGFAGRMCDYVTFDNCTSLNNGWWEMYGSSGIGFITIADIDDNTEDYKIVIRDSISAGNRHFIPWNAGTVRLSDGNGIIMDTTDDHAYSYQGKTLIANNLVYENGGSGIHSFRSDNVDMVNNTVFNNGTTPQLGWGEMFSQESENVNMYNNIVYSRTGNSEDPKPHAYNNNIFFNYKAGSSVGTTVSGVVPGAENLFATNPQFVNLVSRVQKPADFDTETGYPADWYTVKNADATVKPNTWSAAANAAAAGWYVGVNYDVKTYGYDFTLSADSPAWGHADEAWKNAAGGADCANVIGVFSAPGAVLEEVVTPPSPVETVRVTVSADVYPVTVNGVEKTEEFTGEFALGETVTVAASAENFDCWASENGAVLSRETSYTFTVGAPVTVKAVYKIPVENKSFVVWQSAYGQTVKSGQYGAEEITSDIFPTIPFRMGYTATEWTMTAQQISDAIEAGNAEIVVTPNYVKDAVTYTVTVENGTGSGSYEANAVVTVTASAAPDGEKFSHWADAENADGRALSYNASYKFYAAADITVTAVYVEEEIVVEAMGTAEIATVTKNTTTGKLSFSAMLTVPTGCTITYAGIVATKDSTKSETLSAANADYVRGDAASRYSAYRYTWTKGNVGNDTWYVRAYLVYTNAAGKTVTVYGDTVTASLR